jgi:hypothetical protein
LVPLLVGVEPVQRGRARRVAIAEHPRQVGAGGVVGRERVRLVLVDELEPVLDGPQPSQDSQTIQLQSSAYYDLHRKCSIRAK